MLESSQKSNDIVLFRDRKGLIWQILPRQDLNSFIKIEENRQYVNKEEEGEQDEPSSATIVYTDRQRALGDHLGYNNEDEESEEQVESQQTYDDGSPYK